MEARAKICLKCDSLIVDILSWNISERSRWTPVQTDYISLMRSQIHLPDTVDCLQTSSVTCKVCHLINQQVEKLSAGSDATNYSVYITDLRRRRAEFHVAIDDFSRFVHKNSGDRHSRVLVLSSRSGSSDDLPIREIQYRGPQPTLTSLPSSSADSEDAFSQVRSWMQDCRSNHLKCVRKPARLPARILDLEKLESEQTVSLHMTHDDDSFAYSTLSYVWGKDYRLELHSTAPETANLAMRTSTQYLVMKRFAPSQQIPEEICSPDSIPLDIFPRTLRDFILIATQLDFRYVWIDALCIVQNSREDFFNHGARMTEIYEGSDITISASSSTGSDQGVFQAVQDGTLTLFNVNKEGNSVQICIGERLGVPGIEDLHISQRGWTFQERLVSPATVHYTDRGLMWECAHKQIASQHQSLACEPWKADWQMSRNSKAATRREIYDSWTQWVYVYSGRTLSNDEDKLTAVAGIAKIISQQWGLVDSYRAGLWKEHFLSGLLWRRFGRRVKTLIPMRDVAPTWSWASVKGQLEGPNATWESNSGKGQDLRIIECVAREESPGSFGQLSSDSSSTTLVVYGLLQEITVDRQKQAGERPQAWRERGVESGFINTSNVECMLDQWSVHDERFLQCWCLRVGSQAMEGNKVTDHFLLLQKVDSNNHYIRIGTARCDENFDKGKPIPQSGFLSSAALQQLVIL